MRVIAPAAFALIAAVSGTALIVAPASSVIAKDKEAKKAEIPKGKLSKDVQKLLAETDKAMKASDFATAKTALTSADAIPTKSSYDNWYISQFLFDFAKKTNDAALLQNAFERMASSEFLAAEYVPNTLNQRTVFQTLFGMEFNKKNYAKALEWGEKYLATNPSDGQFSSDMTNIALRSKNYAKAEEYATKAIASSKASGQKPTEFVYTSLAEIYQTSKSPKFTQSLRDLVAAYPTGKNWQYMLNEFQLRTKMTDKSSIDVYRLGYVTGALDTPQAINEYAFTAFDGGLAVEAQRIIEQNLASGRIPKSNTDAQDTLRRAKTAIAADDTLAKQEARGAAAKTGDLEAFVGSEYLGAGNYEKAIVLLKRGIGKGVKTTASSTVKLGIAQLMGGDKASAKATFASVTGDARQVELAQLWSLFADTK
jgi:tetratricopeptide (TPR) repeat protein